VQEIKDRFVSRTFKVDLQNLSIILIVTSTFARLFYGLTRNLYGSGPDSIWYIEMMETFASQGVFSEKIPYLPFYPPGYTTFFSVFPLVFSDNWVVFAQMFQIIFLGFSLYLLHDFLKSLLGEFVAFCTVLMITVQTSWIVFPGEAMYESFLIALLITYLSLLKDPILTRKISFKRIAMIGIIGGYIFSVHPRSFILLVLPLFLLGRTIANMKHLATWTLGFLIFPLFFAIRNFVAIDQFTLWSSSFASFNYGHQPDLDGNSVLEISANVIQNPLLFLQDSLVNSFYFFSPFSGPLARGTWFHNISLQAIFFRSGFNQLSSVLSVVIVFISVSVAILGMIYVLRNRTKFNLFLGISFMSIFLTDLFIYGDNRHRLIGQMFIFPLFALFLQSILKHKFPRLSSKPISD
jgi:hypothetical protein